MYCTPCARLIKSMTPKTRVRPEAIRNSRTPSCSPLSTCTMKSVVFMQISEIVFPGPQYVILGSSRKSGLASRNIQGTDDLSGKICQLKKRLPTKMVPAKQLPPFPGKRFMHSIHLTQAEEIEFKGSRY